jgi:hypothetical protein
MKVTKAFAIGRTRETHYVVNSVDGFRFKLCRGPSTMHKGYQNDNEISGVTCKMCSNMLMKAPNIENREVYKNIEESSRYD